jgi:ABC-type dipeptide/oligopeptide/nickel transport system ATPase component
MPDILDIEGLSVRYHMPNGVMRALEEIDLKVPQATRVAIVGESGSGKSTLALAIGGFLTGANVEQTARRFEFDGKPVALSPAGRLPIKKPGLSMVFQDAMTSLDSVWTIESQLAGVLRAHEKLSRREARDRAREWLLRVGLRDTDRVLRSRPYELSGGMRQRVMLAIALCTRPKLLIADEPTSALDAALAENVMELMTELTADLKASLLIITHDIDLCRHFADRVVVFRHGRVVEDLASENLSDARHPYTRGLLACVPTLDSVDLDRLPTLEEFGVRASSANDAEAAL